MINEFDPVVEAVTAVLTSHLSSGENFDGAIIIGYYPETDSEVWFHNGKHRLNIQCSDIDELCKQLKRAKRMASSQIK